MCAAASAPALMESIARAFYEGGVAEKACRTKTLGPNDSPNTQHGVDGFDAAKTARVELPS